MPTSTATIQRPIGRVGHELVVHNAGRCAHWEVPSLGDEKSYQHANIRIRQYPAQVMQIELTEQGRKSAKAAWLDLNEQQVRMLREACDLALGNAPAPSTVLAEALRRIQRETRGYDNMSTMGILHEIASDALREAGQ